MKYRSIKEAATLLNLSERWLQMLCKSGRIPGATRLNSYGPWSIPLAWVEAMKRDKLYSMEGEQLMNRIALVYDEMSIECGEELYENLTKSGFAIDKKGVIPILVHADEEEILDSLYKIIYNASLVLGISSTGNGIAIYANKLHGFTAVPIRTFSDAEQAIKLYGANVFDVISGNQDALSIYKEILSLKG